MSKKKSLIITASILLVLAFVCFVIAVTVGVDRDTVPNPEDTDDITVDNVGSEVDAELAFLTEHRWIRNINCEERINFARDRYFFYSCSCGSPVDDYDLYDTFEYKDGVISLKGFDEEDAVMKVVYYDTNYLCLYLEEEQECRVFVDQNLANDPYIAQPAEKHAGQGWLMLHVLGYDGTSLKVAPYNYDGDAKTEFEEYIRDIPVADGIEFYDVTTVDDKGNVTTEHKKLTSEEMSHIGEYYTSGYAQLDSDGTVKYMVFYGKTVIQ